MPMGWEYTDKVKDHFFKPKNVGRIEDADGEGEVGSIACGDALKLTIKVNRESDTIEDAKFQTFGCGSAIASSSILTEMVIGKTVDEALKVTNKDIADALGGLPPEKMHCSVMGREALEAAIGNFRGEAISEHVDEDEGRIVCSCFGITEGKLRRVIEENKLSTAEDVTNYTKAGGGCGSCLDDIENILEDMWGSEIKEMPAKPEINKLKKLTNLQRIGMIQEIIDLEVRPMLQRDGGDLEIVDIDGPKVFVRLTGHCAGCRSSGLTTGWIEDKLREIVDSAITIVIAEEV
jgi:NifU-like protein